MCARRVASSNGGLAKEIATMNSIRGRLLLTVFLLAFAVPLFAGNIDIDFGTGAAGDGGIITLLSRGNASG